MRLTIIVSDKVIIKDGVAVHLSLEGATQFPTTNNDYHAIQWYENKGSIEKISNNELVWFTDENTLNDYVNAYATEVARLEDL